MTSLNLKKILKNTSSLVVPTIGATLVIGASIAPAEAMIRSGSATNSRAGSPTAERVVPVSAAAQRLMDINSRMASINSAEALTKFMTLKSVYSGNVVEQTGTLADGTHVKTTGFDGVAYVAYTPAQGDKIVAHDAVWEIGGGQAFVAQIDAPREAVLALQGKINAPGVNVALVSGASIFMAAQEINVGKLTVAAGKQVDSVTGGKLKLLDVNPHAAVMFHAGTGASVRDMGATTLIGGAFGAGEGSYFPVVLHTVAGNKVSVDMVGDGLIEYETQANDPEAAALIARSAGDLGVKGIAYASTAEGLAIIHKTVNTDGVLLADGAAKYEGGTIILGSGNPAYTQVEGTVNADVVAVKGQTSESKETAVYNVARLYHGGEWFGGNVNADYLASLGDAVSAKSKELIASNPGIFLAGENSQFTILKEGVRINARDVAVLWSDQKTLTNAKFTSQGGVIERSSKGWVGSFEENELRAQGGLSGDETFANAKLGTGADFVLDDPKHVVFADTAGANWGAGALLGFKDNTVAAGDLIRGILRLGGLNAEETTALAARLTALKADAEAPAGIAAIGANAPTGDAGFAALYGCADLAEIAVIADGVADANQAQALAVFNAITVGGAVARGNAVAAVAAREAVANPKWTLIKDFLRGAGAVDTVAKSDLAVAAAAAAATVSTYQDAFVVSKAIKAAQVADTVANARAAAVAAITASAMNGKDAIIAQLDVARTALAGDLATELTAIKGVFSSYADFNPAAGAITAIQTAFTADNPAAQSMKFTDKAAADAYIASIVKADATTYGVVANAADVAVALGGDTVAPAANYYSLNYGASPNDAVIMDSNSVVGIWGGALNRSMAVRASGDIVVAGDIAKGAFAGSLILQAGRSVLIAADIDGVANGAGSNIIIQAGLPNGDTTQDSVLAGRVATDGNMGKAIIAMKTGTTITGAGQGGYIAISLKNGAGEAGDIILANIIAPKGNALNGQSVFVSNRSGGNILQVAGNHAFRLGDAGDVSPFIFHTTGGSVGTADQAINLVSDANSGVMGVVANVAGGVYINATSAGAQGMTQGVNLSNAAYDGVLKVLLADDDNGWNVTTSRWRWNATDVVDIGTFFGAAQANKSRVFGIKATGDVVISKAGANDFGFADFLAQGSLWGGSIVTADDKDVVIRSERAIVHAGANVDKSVIKARHVGLIAVATVGGVGANAYIPLDIKGSVVGHAQAGIFKVKGLSDLMVGISDAGLLAGMFDQTVGTRGAAIAPANAGTSATNVASGYLWSVTTTNGIPVFLTGHDHKVLLNKAKDGTVGSVVSTAGNIVVQAGDIQNVKDNAGYLHVEGANTISLNATKGNVGSLASPIQVSGRNAASSVNAKAATDGTAAADDTASIFLKAKTNIVLGAGDVAGAVNAGVADNVVAIGKGNVFIDGLTKKVTFNHGAGSVTAAKGVIAIKAGEIDSATPADGITGSKVSLYAQQDTTSDITRGATGKIGRTAPVLLTNPVAADEMLIEAMASAEAINAAGVFTQANAGGVVLGFGAADTKYRITETSIAAGVDAFKDDAEFKKIHGVSAGKDGVARFVLGAASKVVLGKDSLVLTDATETAISAPFGSIQFVADAAGGSTSTVTVASANVMIESSVLNLSGGNAAQGSVIGDVGLFSGNDAQNNKRLWWKITPAQNATNGALGTGILISDLTGNAYIQALGDVAFGGADEVAATANNTYAKARYGIYNSKGTEILDAILAPNASTVAVVANKTLRVSATDASGAATRNIFVSNVLADPVVLGNASSLVLEGKSAGYINEDGYKTEQDTTRGRISLGQDANLVLMLSENAGEYTKDLSSKRLKIGQSVNGQSAFVLGSVKNAHFHVVNVANAGSFISFGSAVDFADWTAGRVAATPSIRNLVMTGGDASVMSVTASAAADTNHIKFMGAAGANAVDSKGSIAIETGGLLAGLANTVISAKNVMFKASTIGHGAPILVDLAQGGRITLESANASAVTAPTSDLMFGGKGLTAEKDSIGGIFVDGFKGNGAKTLVATKGTVSFAEGFDAAGAVDVTATGDNGKVNFLGDATFANGLTTHAKTATDLTSVISVGGNTSITADKGDLTTSGKGAVKLTANADLTFVATEGTIGSKDARFAVDTGNFNVTSLTVQSKTGTRANFAGTGAITTANAVDAIKVTKGDTDLLIGGNFTLTNNVGAVIGMPDGNLSVVSSNEAAVFDLRGANAVTLPKGHMNFVAHSYQTNNARLDAYEGITFGFIGANAGDDLSLTATGIGAHVKKVVIGAKGADVAFTAGGAMNFGAAALKDIFIGGKSIANGQALQAIEGASVKLDIQDAAAMNFTAAGAKGLTVSGNVGSLVSTLAGTKTTFTSFKITGEDATVQSRLSANTAVMLGIGKDVDFGLNFELTQTNNTAFTNTKDTRFKVGKLDVVGAKGTFFTAANEMHVALTGGAVRDGSLTVNNESDKLAINTAWGLTSEDNGGAVRTVSLTQSGELAFDKTGSFVRSVAANNDKLVHFVLNAGKVTSADTWTAGTHVDLSDAAHPGSGSANFTFTGSTADNVVLKTNVARFEGLGLTRVTLENAENLIAHVTGKDGVASYADLRVVPTKTLVLDGVQSKMKTMLFTSDAVDASLYDQAKFTGNKLDVWGVTTPNVYLVADDKVLFDNGVALQNAISAAQTTLDGLIVARDNARNIYAVGGAAGSDAAKAAFDALPENVAAAATKKAITDHNKGAFKTANDNWNNAVKAAFDLSIISKGVKFVGTTALDVSAGVHGQKFATFDIGGAVSLAKEDKSSFNSASFALNSTGVDELKIILGDKVVAMGDSSVRGKLVVDAKALSSVDSIAGTESVQIKTAAADLSGVKGNVITADNITLESAETIGAHGAIGFKGDLTLVKATKATVHAQDGAAIKSLGAVVDLTASGDAGLLSGVTTGLTSFTYDALAADMDVAKLTSVAGAKAVELKNIEKATGAFTATSATNVTISANNHELTGLKTAKNGKVVLDGKVSTKSDHAFAHSIKVDGYDAGDLSIWVSGEVATELKAVETPEGTPDLVSATYKKESAEVNTKGFKVAKDVKVGSTDLGESFDMFFNATNFKENGVDITDVDAVEALHNAQTTFENTADVKAYFDGAAQSLPEAERTLVNAARLVQTTSKNAAVATSLLSRVKAEGRFVRDWNQSKDFFGSKIKVSPLLIQRAQ